MKIAKDGQNLIQLLLLTLSQESIDSFSPEVPANLNDFVLKYATKALRDAQLYAENKGRDVVNVDDIGLALKFASWTRATPLPVKKLKSYSRTTNNSHLPQVYGFKLPTECLTGINYALKKKPPTFIV